MRKVGSVWETVVEDYLRRSGLSLIARNVTSRYGEIDLVMPLEPEAQFDGHGAGWVVYGPGSAHHPTVTRGRALVLYLLPAGAIEFTRT